MGFYPLCLAGDGCFHPPPSLGAALVPRMVAAVAVGALRCDLLLRLVLGKAVVGLVRAAAYPTLGRIFAAGNAVPEAVAPVAPHWLWGVRAEVKGSPYAQVQLPWKRALVLYEDLSCFASCGGVSASGGRLHASVALKGL